MKCNKVVSVIKVTEIVGLIVIFMCSLMFVEE